MVQNNNNIAVETPEQEKKRLRKVATATIVGSMLEWYDFYLYATMAALVLDKCFLTLLTLRVQV